MKTATARRLLVGGTTALALTTGGLAAVATPAQAASEWKAVAKSGTNNCRERSLAIGGRAVSWSKVCWSGTKVWTIGFAGDTSDDGLAAVLNVRYRIKKNGKWSGWHHRRLAVDKNPYGEGKWSSWQRSRFPTKDLHFKLCLQDGSVVYSCSGAWS
ncbi:hypothetical protein GCM10010168_25680 [Actinoplanes ianthinogenes]|uniref:Secreted protein n=1 Tax=Actinoplanes ianthinogenes TaxID=122358 RepID=A0ABN6CSJ1_9ACTN|nr:hypothetical protein [Actinoplanes ianthinogenes]BCJ48208.1 hypothetical protein Aiant_88650 [Actinoplanes ianthinogenes]GGR07150.1 hypothetical protein GCM10010168_25680 [Actinoplanes ianthinogenes]